MPWCEPPVPPAPPHAVRWSVWTSAGTVKCCVTLLKPNDCDWGAAAADAAGTSSTAPSASASARRRYLRNMGGHLGGWRGDEGRGGSGRADEARLEPVRPRLATGDW